MSYFPLEVKEFQALYRTIIYFEFFFFFFFFAYNRKNRSGMRQICFCAFVFLGFLDLSNFLPWVLGVMEEGGKLMLRLEDETIRDFLL